MPHINLLSPHVADLIAAGEWAKISDTVRAAAELVKSL